MPPTTLRHLTRPFLPKTILRPSFTTPIQTRLAHSGYGSTDGDPKASNPKDQGHNPSSSLEHPGPPPPDVGKGSGSSPTKAAGMEKSSENNEGNSNGAGKIPDGKKKFSTCARSWMPAGGKGDAGGEGEGGGKSTKETEEGSEELNLKGNPPERDGEKLAKEGAKPTLSEKNPADGEESKEVKEHNEEVDRRGSR